MLARPIICLLASGGGTADRTIRFWNTSSGTLRNTVDTKSQVRAPVVAVTGTLRAAVLLCFVATLSLTNILYNGAGININKSKK